MMGRPSLCQDKNDIDEIEGSDKAVETEGQDQGLEQRYGDIAKRGKAPCTVYHCRLVEFVRNGLQAAEEHHHEKGSPPPDIHQHNGDEYKLRACQPGDGGTNNMHT